MKNAQFDLHYPSNSGFKKSAISFYKGEPDLKSLFYSNGSSDNLEKEQRLFVTDNTISELPCIKNFTSLFTKDISSKANSTTSIAVYKKDILLVLGSGEKYKTIDSVLSIIKTALDFNLSRKCTFVAIGGGVISDMTGFASSAYKRGVSVEFVPTTLLSMVDASVGGKTGCDFEGYKNMVGSFYPARNIYIFPSFVKSLPENEYRSGLAEAIKTALLFSKGMCSIFSNEKENVASRDDETLFKIIDGCVRAKSSVVHKDFREKSKRALLNYGHTFGHALESVAGLGKVTHGEAVAWGIGRALDLGVALGLTNKSYAENAKQMLSSYGYDMESLQKAVAPADEKDGESLTDARLNKANEILSSVHKDKKNSGSKMIRVIMQKSICRNIIQEVSENDILSVLK